MVGINLEKIMGLKNKNKKREEKKGRRKKKKKGKLHRTAKGQRRGRGL